MYNDPDLKKLIQVDRWFSDFFFDLGELFRELYFPRIDYS